MDHEVVPRTCKICDWLLNSSRDHFSLHQVENVRVTMKFEVPRRRILRPTLSIDMVQRVLQWERQKRCSSSKRQGPMAKKYCYNKILMIFFLRTRRWRQEKSKEWSNLNVLKTAPFVSILKTKTHSLFGAWAFLLVHIWFTPSEGPKCFVNWFSKKLGHGSWTTKSDHGKRPSSVVRLHGPWCKLALSWVSTIGGAKNELDPIWNYTLFVLTTKHCTSRFKLKKRRWSDALVLSK